MARGLRISSRKAAAGSRWWRRAPSAASCCAPRRSGCATTSPAASRATTSRRAGRLPYRSSVPRAPSDMSVPAEQHTSRYPARLAGLSRLWLAQLVRAPSDPRHQDAARQMRRQVAWLLALGAVLVVVLMVGFDVTEIGWMPPRGTPSLWPVRILTDFGKDAYVLWTL